MRIPIREQLALLLLLSSAIGLGIVSLATWLSNNDYLQQVRTTRLSFSASLKASQIQSNLALLENSAQFIASRIVVQSALGRYNRDGNNSASNWQGAIPDMAAAIGGPASGGAVGNALLLQSQIFGANASGPAGSTSLLNTTNPDILGDIPLGITRQNGTQVFLGDTDQGYPPQLYPNLTFTSRTGPDGQLEQTAQYNGASIGPGGSSALLLGPWSINSSFAILSLTVPIINNTSSTNVLGWLCIVMDARLLSAVINNEQGLDETGEMLLVRPNNGTNMFPTGVSSGNDSNPAVYNNQLVRYVLPLSTANARRHPGKADGMTNPAFNITDYPVLVEALTTDQQATNNAGGQINTQNELGQSVAAGYAIVNVPYVDWVVVVEQDRSEAMAAITRLQRVIIACLFGTLVGMVIVSWPLAHFASQPIRDLKNATMKTVMPMDGYNGSNESLEDNSGFEDFDGAGSLRRSGSDAKMAKKEGFISTVFRRRRKSSLRNDEEHRRTRQFRIPGKVPDRKHLIKDELSELTSTFNAMSDELTMQYTRLEERVQQRTAELEVSKKAAEAANESKTLFIANISHELKTPLNGILGMCAVCMQEDDPIRLKRSLGIIYKSGDLLLNLLTDLLTFSKNQVGQQLSLDEKEFRIRDISTQILAIFDKQAREGQIDLSVQYMRGDELETKENMQDPTAHRIKDMILWGDTHRILQVIINLVSNSLKFTPPQGKVTLTIRCTSEQIDVGSRKGSMGSRASKRLPSRQKHGDGSPLPGRASGSQDGSTHIERTVFSRVMELDRPAPPPGKTLMFEFEVMDTGPGIPENLHQAIFEPFVQGDLGLSKKYGGTGLGLSICSQLAGLMHGSMSLKSEVNVGSTFTMRIPLRYLMARADSTASSNANMEFDTASISSNDAFNTPRRRSLQAEAGPAGSPAIGTQSEAPQEKSFQPRLVGLSQPYFATDQPMESPGSQPAAMEQITAAASSSGRIRVLVAEDNKVNQEVVLRMLKLEDIYDVTVAKDGQEALDMVKESMSPSTPLGQKGPFNLIFMDVQMPNLDGLQSTKLIREIGFDKPIVALTAFAEESNVKDCLDSGMNYFLSKPIRRPALKKVLKEYCTPIQEVDEDAVTPPPGPGKSGGADKGASTVSNLDGNRTIKPLPTSPTKVDVDTGKSIDLAMTNVPGSPTVVIISRPSSVDGVRPTTKSLEGASS